MRARSAIQRFPVAHWKEQLASMHEIAIKVNQKSAIKHGLELRGEYNTSLASSALPSSNTSAVHSPPQSSCQSYDPIKEDDEAIGISRSTTSTPEPPAPEGLTQTLSLGVRAGPSSSGASSRGVSGKVQRDSFRVRNSYRSSKFNEDIEKQGALVSQDQADSNSSSRKSSVSKKHNQNRDSFATIAKAFSHFRFRDSLTIDTTKTRLTGDPVNDEKEEASARSSAGNEVLLTPEQATASNRMSIMATDRAVESVRKSSSVLPVNEQMLRKASYQQQATDAYLALSGRSRQGGGKDESQSSPTAPSFVTSPHPSNPQTPITPNFPQFSTVRDFAATASPSKAHPTETFETRRGTIIFDSSGSVSSYEHPVVDNPRFSYGTVLQGKKDYALQNVEPFFTDPTGLYYKAFHLELKDLNSKNSEDALCIENFLMMSEKDWYNRLHKVKMGKRASKARPATIFGAPERRAGSVVPIFNENVESAAIPDNSAEQYLLKEKYEPPTGLKKLLLRRPRQWPFYSFLLAFVSWIYFSLLLTKTDIFTGPNHCRQFLPSDPHQRSNWAISEQVICDCNDIPHDLDHMVDDLPQIEVYLGSFSTIWILRSCLPAFGSSTLRTRCSQRMASKCGNRDLCNCLFKRSILLFPQLRQ